MSVYEPIMRDECPKCGAIVESEGINNGIGYVYPPLHCRCGWSEMCSFEGKEECKKCDQYENCYKKRDLIKEGETMNITLGALKVYVNSFDSELDDCKVLVKPNKLLVIEPNGELVEEIIIKKGD